VGHCHLLAQGSGVNPGNTLRTHRDGLAAWNFGLLCDRWQKGLAGLNRTQLPPSPTLCGPVAFSRFAVLNDLVLNQVLVSVGTAQGTRRIIAAIQEDGTCWCGGTVSQGHTAMRISVSSWATTDDDVERSPAAIINVAKQLKS
jgi:hypothetical protein